MGARGKPPLGEPREVGGDQVGRVPGTGSLSVYLDGNAEARSRSQSRDQLRSGRMGEGSWEPHEVAVIQARVVGRWLKQQEDGSRRA